jgi:hypothetical protein
MLSPAELAALITAMTLLIPVVFGTLTIRQWQRARRLSAAAELVHTLMTPEFTRAIVHIVDLPEAADAGTVASRPGMPEAVTVISHAFESLGVLVFHRLLPLHLVDDLVGGYVRASWKRAGPYIIARRPIIGANLGEWYQWLAERMEEDPSPGKSAGAQVFHKDWKR